MILKLFHMYSVVLFILFLAPSPRLCCDSTHYLSNNFRLIKLHYENSSGEKGLTTFIYDENEIINKAYWQLNDGSRSSENYYTYNEEENLIKKYREFSDGITSTQSYEYDQKGNLISEHFSRSDGVTGTTEYKYDKDEKLVKAICNGFAGWFYGTIIYEYDVNGRKFKGIIEKDEKQVGTINFEYGTAGNLLKEYWEFQDSWSQTFIYEYEKVRPD